MFGLFKKNYDDWYTYIKEKEFPTISYGHNHYSELKFAKVICRSSKNNPETLYECGKQIPTGLSCKILKDVRTGSPLIQVTCPSCNDLVEFSVDLVSFGEMSERENEKKKMRTKIHSIDALSSGTLSK